MAAEEKNYRHFFFQMLKQHNSENINHPADISINEALSQAGRIIEDASQEQHLSDIDCSKGCGYCCRLNIPTLPPEAWKIVSFIRNNFNIDEFSYLIDKIHNNAFQIKYLDDDDRIACKIECIFLNSEKSCSIYPVRPVLCRSVTSLDREDCKRALESVFTGEHHTILMNTFVKNLYNDLFIAITDFLESVGLSSKSEEITQAVKNILENHE
jgi:Fe-S-cluster containining protein